MVRLTAHWATLGKQPASLDDYEVIDCSAGAITRTRLQDVAQGVHLRHHGAQRPAPGRDQLLHHR